jgi:hypothetical protein
VAVSVPQYSGASDARTQQPNIIQNKESAMSQATHEHDRDHDEEPTARHTMVLFGDTTLYLSHMPEFHPPHNEQVVVTVRLSKDGEKPEDDYRADRRSTGKVMYSLQSPQMHIDKLKAGTSFTANVHRDNVEEDGARLLPGVTVTVESVVHIAELDPATPKDPDAGRRYLCFGQPGEFFALHEITGAPSFDHIIEIDLGAAGNLSLPIARPLRVPGEDTPDGRLQVGESADAELLQTDGSNGEAVHTTITAGKKVFFDATFLKK